MTELLRLWLLKNKRHMNDDVSRIIELKRTLTLSTLSTNLTRRNSEYSVRFFTREDSEFQFHSTVAPIHSMGEGGRLRWMNMTAAFIHMKGFYMEEGLNACCFATKSIIRTSWREGNFSSE